VIGKEEQTEGGYKDSGEEEYKDFDHKDQEDKKEVHHTLIIIRNKIFNLTI